MKLIVQLAIANNKAADRIAFSRQNTDGIDKITHAFCLSQASNKPNLKNVSRQRGNFGDRYDTVAVTRNTIGDKLHMATWNSKVGNQVILNSAATSGNLHPMIK